MAGNRFTAVVVGLAGRTGDRGGDRGGGGDGGGRDDCGGVNSGLSGGGLS